MKRRILVAEDSFEVRIALEMALSHEGYEPRACPDGESAWQEFEGFDPDLALLDIRMPGLSGTELCKLIRESSNIPIIIFSAIEDRAEKLEAFEVGADDYVVKGTGIDELLIRVAAQLRWKRERNRDEDDEESLDSGQPDLLGALAAETIERSQERPEPAVAKQTGKGRRKTRKKRWTKLSRIKVPRFDGEQGTAILVNDSRVDDRERLVRFLKRQGEPVIETESGAQTLVTVGKYLPWLVITELVVPDMSGIDLLKVIYDHPRTVNVATMIISSKGTPEARAIAGQYGALDYIVKPWTEEEVALRIEWARQSLRRRIALHGDSEAA